MAAEHASSSPLPLGRLRARRGPVPFEDLALGRAARVTFLAPHPDDFDSAGVTMKRLCERGHDVRLIVLTGGAAGVSDSFATPATDERKNAIREREQKLALEFFGLPADNARFERLAVDEDGELLVDAACRHAISTMLAGLEPDVIVLPHGEDTNAGHRRTCRLARQFAASSTKPLLALYLRDPKTVRMRIDVYVAFDREQAEWKRRLLLHHRSQHARNLATRGAGFDDRILAVNQQSASDLALDVSYAEVFEVELFEHDRHRQPPSPSSRAGS